MSISVINPSTSGVGGANTQVQFNDNNVIAGDSGLTYNKTTDTLTIANTVIVPTIRAATTGDVSLVLQPIGNGSFQLNSSDGTNANGGVRGGKAIDLQLVRNSPTQIASGLFSFVTGNSNVASGNNSFVVGNSNFGRGENCFVTGASNTALSNSTHIFITGSSNISEGLATFTCGEVNNVSGRATFAAGSFNTSSGFNSFVIGSGSTSKSISNIFVLGSRIIDKDKFQLNILNLGGETTNNTPKIIVSDLLEPLNINQLILQNNSALAFTGIVNATTTNAGDCASWEFKGQIQKGATNNSTALVTTITPTLITNKPGASTWLVSITADTTIGCLRVTVTGQTGKTIRWNCTIYASEVAF